MRQPNKPPWKQNKFDFENEQKNKQLQYTMRQEEYKEQLLLNNRKYQFYKAISLQNYLKAYQNNGPAKDTVIRKFTSAFGYQRAIEFLEKYDESLNMISSFTTKDMDDFMRKF